ADAPTDAHGSAHPDAGQPAAASGPGGGGLRTAAQERARELLRPDTRLSPGFGGHDTAADPGGQVEAARRRRAAGGGLAVVGRGAGGGAGDERRGGVLDSEVEVLTMDVLTLDNLLILPRRGKHTQLSAIITFGRLAGSGSAFCISSRTIHGTFPSPNSKNPSVPLTGLSSVQPKWIVGGLPTF